MITHDMLCDLEDDLFILEDAEPNHEYLAHGWEIIGSLGSNVSYAEFIEFKNEIANLILQIKYQ